MKLLSFIYLFYTLLKSYRLFSFNEEGKHVTIQLSNLVDDDEYHIKYDCQDKDGQYVLVEDLNCLSMEKWKIHACAGLSVQPEILYL